VEQELWDRSQLHVQQQLSLARLREIRRNASTVRRVQCGLATRLFAGQQHFRAHDPRSRAGASLLLGRDSGSFGLGLLRELQHSNQ